ncbi:MAG: polysaccharide deacetylase family protein [Acidobacteriia bacterium]|nr:polysaccharide deacetylase family protein [Terriglobia bacterium]
MDKVTEPLILTYHSISAGRPPLATPPPLFTEQMEWLAANARVTSLSDLVEALVGGRTMPPRSVVLTFDDALLDFYSQAAPVLRRLGLPAAVFVPTGHCGRTTRWATQLASVEERPLMSWPQVREMAEQGFILGAHSVSHPMLTEIIPAKAEREIVDSKAELESRIGGPVEFFCYPYGYWNADLREVVKSHYRAACSTTTGVVGRNADVFALPRVDAYYLRRPTMFRNLFSQQMGTYLGLRRMLRRIRGYGQAS